MENKVVTLQLQSTIQQDKSDTIQQKHTATYHVVNGIHYLRFDDEQTGKNTLKIDSQHKIVTCLWEKHAIKRVVFSKQERTIMTYQLPQGMLSFDVQTTTLMCQFNAKGELTAFKIHYLLKQDGQLFGRYRLHYTVHY